MWHVLGICGSLRAESHNAKLLDVVAGLLPDQLRMRTFNRLDDIPPYNAELDTEPAPSPVAELRAAIRACDALIITTPEYNHSIPGVLHNALNWASHPTNDLPLTGKAIAVLVATPGQHLGHRGLGETIRILTGFGNIVIPGPEVVINNAHQRLIRSPDGSARLTDPKACEQITAQLAVLVDLLHARAAHALGDALRRHVTGVWW